MGLDVSGMIIIGVKIVKREILEKITKFNEDTGLPYTKEIKNKIWFIEETNTKLNKEEYPEFYLYCNGFEEDTENEGILGKCISSTDLREPRHLIEVNVNYEPKRTYPFTLKIYNFLSFG
jgi:hypothetical protein